MTRQTGVGSFIRQGLWPFGLISAEFSDYREPRNAINNTHKQCARSEKRQTVLKKAVFRLILDV